MTNPKIQAAAALTHRRMAAGRTRECSGPRVPQGSTAGMTDLRACRGRLSQRARADGEPCIGAFVPKVFN